MHRIPGATSPCALVQRAGYRQTARRDAGRCRRTPRGQVPYGDAHWITTNSNRPRRTATHRDPAAGSRTRKGAGIMAEPEFKATGVRIGKKLRSLTRAGQVRISDGRLRLLTSYGSEIDSAP